jgi:hypothetical protein
MNLMNSPKQAKPKLFSQQANRSAGKNLDKFPGARPGRSSPQEIAIAEEATRNIRAALTGSELEDPLEADISLLSGGLFSRKRSSEIIMSDRQTEQMRDALTQRARAESIQRVRSARIGFPVDDQDLPQLHKAQKLTFSGRNVMVHLGTRGTEGKNIVAIPKLIQSGDSTLKMGRGVDILDLDLLKDGRQEIPVRSDFVEKSKKIQVQICFSDQRENLRRKQREENSM